MNDKHKIEISMTCSRGGRQKMRSSRVLEISGYGQDSFLFLALKEFEKKAHINPVSPTIPSIFDAAIKCLRDTSISYLRLPPTALSKDQIHDLLRNTDYDCINSNGSTSLTTRIVRATTFRRLIAVSRLTLGDGFSTTDATDNFKSQYRLPPRTKSNYSGIEIAPDSRSSYESLKSRALENLTKRSREISEACAKDINAYTSCVETQNKLLLTKKLENHSKIIDALQTKASPKTKFLDLMDSGDLEWMLLHLFNTKNEIETKNDMASIYKTLPPSSLFANSELVRSYQIGKSILPWIFATKRLPNSVLTSIFILILQRTSWNIASVGSLTTDSIESTSNSRIKIQGRKIRTDDHTPYYEVDFKDHALKTALKLLAWNNKQLKNLCIIKNNQHELWFGWQKYGYEHCFDPIGSPNTNEFFRKHNITPMALRGLRELGASKTYLETSDIDIVRAMLGHKSFNITSSYLNAKLMHQLYKTNILEYSTRLSTTAVFLNGGINLLESRGLDKKYVDTTLLPVTAVGTPCTNPDHPPPEFSSGKGPCTGLMCIQQGGCPNQLNVISAYGLSVAFETLEMYRYQWRKIWDANHQAFSDYHFPRILYIHALIKFVKEKRPDVVADALELLEGRANKIHEEPVKNEL